MKVTDERLKELMATNLPAMPFSIRSTELASIIKEVMEWRANTSPNVQQPA